MPDAQPKPPLRCPKCRCTDRLVLIEVTENVGITLAGEIGRDDCGRLLPPSDFYFEPRDVTAVEVECDACGHHWTPRRGRVTDNPDALDIWGRKKR